MYLFSTRLWANVVLGAAIIGGSMSVSADEKVIKISAQKYLKEF